MEAVVNATELLSRVIAWLVQFELAVLDHQVGYVVAIHVDHLGLLLQHLPLVDILLPLDGALIEEKSEFFVDLLVLAQFLNFLYHLEADFFRAEALLARLTEIAICVAMAVPNAGNQRLSIVLVIQHAPILPIICGRQTRVRLLIAERLRPVLALVMHVLVDASRVHLVGGGLSRKVFVALLLDHSRACGATLEPFLLLLPLD